MSNYFLEENCDSCNSPLATDGKTIWCTNNGCMGSWNGVRYNHKDETIMVTDVIVKLGLSNSLAEARELVCQNVVLIDGVEITDPFTIVPNNVQNIKVGEKSFTRIDDVYMKKDE